MIILADLIVLLIIAFCSAAFSKFLDFCFEDGNILSFYYKWLLKAGQVKADAQGHITSHNFFWKPLGGCLLCFNFWVSVPGFVWIASEYHHCYHPVILFMLFFFYQGCSGFFVQIVRRSYE